VSRIVVCDTGPLLHLDEAGAIHLLEATGKILIPAAVSQELEGRLKLPSWVETQDLHKSAQRKATEWNHSEALDSGEAEAIALAMQINSDWFLTDDALARQFSESLGLETHGSIGILLWAVAHGHIQDRSEAHECLSNLVNSSLWISNRVVNEASRAIDELLSE
jgi:predicted nucleic acid-binding protein